MKINIIQPPHIFKSTCLSLNYNTLSEVWAGFQSYVRKLGLNISFGKVISLLLFIVIHPSMQRCVLIDYILYRKHSQTLALNENYIISTVNRMTHNILNTLISKSNQLVKLKASLKNIKDNLVDHTDIRLLCLCTNIFKVT